MRIHPMRAALLTLLLATGPVVVSAQAQLPLDLELRPGATVGCAPDVGPPAPRSVAPANAIKVLPPAQGLYQGAFQLPVIPGDVQRFAQSVGHFPPIVFSFHDMFGEDNASRTPDRTLNSRMEGDNSVPPLTLASYLDERGAVLALAWAMYCCDINSTRFWLRLKKPHKHFNRLLAGEYDPFLRRSAQQIKAYGRPLMLTLVPEFNWQGQMLFGADGRRWMESVDNICNQYGDPSWPDGPERIRDAFMHLIDLFREEGVTNVTWFMYGATNYMASVEGQSLWLHPKYYYPGDAYIDWVGSSAYYGAPGAPQEDGEILPFNQAVVPGYQAWRSVTNKPIFLPEFGVVAPKGFDRSAAWSELLSQQLPNLPGVKAITIADSLLAELVFGVPMLSDSPSETAALRQSAQTRSASRPAKLRLSR